jgi:hypothetical protein
MKKAIVLACAIALPAVHGKAEPPSPLGVANTVSNLWFSNNLSGLSAYAANLYSGQMTNYLPAVLVSAFHDHLFGGRLISASNKCARVQAFASSHPQTFTDTFKGMLEIVSRMADGDIGMVLPMNLDPVQVPSPNISPQAVRNDSGDTFMPPHIAILYHAPPVMLQ